MSDPGAGVRRYFETVRHLRWRQITNRLRRRLLPPAARTFDDAKLISVKDWRAPIAKIRQLSTDGKLSIFGIARDASSPALWFDDTVPRLWLYHAHYCDDVACADVSDRDKHRLIASWISANAPSSAPGWDPYPASRRIVNWLKFYLAGGQLKPDAVNSLAAQADLLARNLEFHLLGNHLLANLKALIFAGLLIDAPGSGKWAVLGEEHLRRQLSEQILADGAHHELSPMYHAVVLEDLLDLANLCAVTRPDLAAQLRPLCTDMLDWLQHMTHPDGGVAFFNDAALNGCAPIQEILRYAHSLGVNPAAASAEGLWDLQASGYVRMQLHPMTLICDLAQVGPPHLPGHAHADTLSFELSLAGQRIIVNSGTSTYENDANRRRQRGTGAHNTVVVDGENSSDVWSAFRVGERATVFDRRVDKSPNGYHACASHDGYRRRAGVVHRRSFELSPGLLVIKDSLTGAGKHKIQWHMHLHPDVQATQTGPGRYRLRWADQAAALDVEFDQQLHTRLRKSTFYPGFGRQVPSTRLTAATSLKLPCEMTVTCRIAS